MAKSPAPVLERKQPGTFCLSLGMRRSRSAGDCVTRPRVPGRRGRGGLPASAVLRMVS